jgi:tellurite resistance protein TehA-like permease
MNSEIEKSFKTNLSSSKKKPIIQNIGKHLRVRVGIFIGLLSLWYLLINNLENDYYGGGSYLILLIFGLCFLIFFLVMIIEVFIFQKNKKIKLRNANLIFMGLIALVIMVSSLIGKQY